MQHGSAGHHARLFTFLEASKTPNAAGKPASVLTLSNASGANGVWKDGRGIAIDSAFDVFLSETLIEDVFAPGIHVLAYTVVPGVSARMNTLANVSSPSTSRLAPPKVVVTRAGVSL